MWNVPTLKSKWLFDYMNNVRLHYSISSFGKTFLSLILAGCLPWGACSTCRRLSYDQGLVCSICLYNLIISKIKLLKGEKQLIVCFRCLATFVSMVISFPFKLLTTFLHLKNARRPLFVCLVISLQELFLKNLLSM